MRVNQLVQRRPIGKVRATNGQREEDIVFQYRRTATPEARLICELLGLAVMCGVQSIAHLGWRCLHIKPIQSLVLRLQASLCEHVQQREQAIDIAMGHAESKGEAIDAYGPSWWGPRQGKPSSPGTVELRPSTVWQYVSAPPL